MKKRSTTFLLPILFVVLIWLIKIIEWSFSLNFAIYGIMPRSIEGLLGILTSPLIHGDFIHLLSNTFTFLIITVGLFYFYQNTAYKILIGIYIGTGLLVWLFAREAYHIGASGIIYGMVSFLFFVSIFKKNLKLMSLSLAVLVLFGGMIYGIFPTDIKISWESHLMGSIVGLLLALYYFKQPLEDETITKDPEIDSNKDYTQKHHTTYQYFYKPKEKKDDEATH